MTPKVTIGVVNYNGAHLLPDCLNALSNLSYPNYDIVVVDNDSKDQSVSLVNRQFPDVSVLQLDSNGGLNVARNAALSYADADYVFLIENDAVAHPDCLTHLMHVMLNMPDIVSCSPRVVGQHDSQVVQYDGAWIHYVGGVILETEYIHQPAPPPRALPVANGIILVDKRKARRFGYFDEDYFLAWSEGEFSVRMTILGLNCMQVSEAIVYHKIKDRGLARVYEQIRNRWYFILSLYSLRTLVLISPALIAYELSLVMVSLFQGFISEYFKANFDVIKNLSRIYSKRQIIQNSRAVSDKCILRTGELFVSNKLIENKAMAFAKSSMDRLFSLYWNLVSVFI